MKKIVFVTTYDYSGSRNSLPLGQLSLAGVLKATSNYEVEVVDLNRLYQNKKLSFANDIEIDLNIVADYLVALEPTFVSIYTMCNNYHLALLLAQIIKKCNPKVKIIFAGPQASLTAKETLSQFEYVDFIGLGEGEKTIVGILTAILTNNFSDVNGLAYRGTHDEIIIQWDRSEQVDLNNLPMLDISMLGLDTVKNIDIEVGRGCPFSCTYCSTRLFWGNNYRLKGIERIISEIKHYHTLYKTNFFSFQHDLFTANRKFILEFCQRLKGENLNISWGCSSRIDTVDSEMIALMSEAGCKEIFFGVETGSEKMQKLINKKLDLSYVSVLMDELIKYEIIPTFSFIYGFPLENSEDLNKTLQMMYVIKRKFLHEKVKVKLQLWPLNYLAGTEITEENYDQLELVQKVRYDFHYSTILSNPKIKNLIVQNKNIFMGYYTLTNTAIAYNSELLNSLYMKLLNLSYNYINLTVDLLVSHYHQDIYKLISDITRTTTSQLQYASIKELLLSNGIVIEEIKQIINVIKEFIHFQDFGVNTILLSELIDFEENLFMTIFATEDVTKQVNYTYDVFAMKKHNEVYTNKKDIVLEFHKSNETAHVQYVKRGWD